MVTSITLSCTALVTIGGLISLPFGMFMAENYHKRVLNENIQELGYENFVITDIEYEEYTRFFDADNQHNFHTQNIYITCDVPYDVAIVNDVNKETNLIFNKMDIQIDYNWAGENIHFENYDRNVHNKTTVVITDNNGTEIEIQNKS